MITQTSRYLIQENKVLFTNSEICFDFPIQDAIEIDDMLIVYCNLKDRVIPLEENVFGISIIQEEVKWQIQKRKYPKGGYSKMKCPFVGISFRNNELILHNWCSTYLIVNPETGKVLEQEETR